MKNYTSCVMIFIFLNFFALKLAVFNSTQYVCIVTVQQYSMNNSRTFYFGFCFFYFYFGKRKGNYLCVSV